MRGCYWREANRWSGKLICLLLLLTGCASDLPESKTSLSIDLTELLKNIPVLQHSSAFSGPASSDPTHDAISALVVGPLTFTNHGQAYDPDQPPNETVKAHLKKDLPNTAQYIEIISLPFSGDTVEIEVPPVSDGWQLFAVGLSKTPKNLEDLGTTEYQDAMVYYTVDTNVYSDAEEAYAAGITMTLKRACLASPTPKGCAIFDDHKQAVVTASVEILDVLINGSSDCSITFPLIVTTADNATSAKSMLNSCISSSSKTITTLKVETSHQLNPNASSSCTSATTVSGLRSSCGSQTYSNTY